MLDANRFKNVGLWVAVAAFIPMLLEGYGINILPYNYGELTQTLLAILVLAGILNDPTTENKFFLDDKKNEE